MSQLLSISHVYLSDLIRVFIAVSRFWHETCCSWFLGLERVCFCLCFGISEGMLSFFTLSCCTASFSASFTVTLAQILVVFCIGRLRNICFYSIRLHFRISQMNLSLPLFLFIYLCICCFFTDVAFMQQRCRVSSRPRLAPALYIIYESYMICYF